MTETAVATITLFGKPISAEVIEALAAGSIRHEVGTVTIRKDSSPTGKEESRNYDKLVALDELGMAALCGGKMEVAVSAPEEGEEDNRTEAEKATGAADYFNYGFDLAVRQRVRQQLERDLEGPEKTMRQNIVALIKGGIFTREEAIATVVNQARTKGTVPPDYVLPDAVLSEIKE